MGAADCSPSGVMDSEDCVCGEFRFFKPTASPRAGQEQPRSNVQVKK
jgi:hypothetical protein